MPDELEVLLSQMRGKKTKKQKKGSGGTTTKEEIDSLLNGPNGSKFRRFFEAIQAIEGGEDDLIVGGKLRFDPTKGHPKIVGLTTKEGPSTAAGRYQITGTNYDALAPRLGVTDFTPETQLRMAMMLLGDRDKNAFRAIENEDWDAAANVARLDWTSVPGSTIGGGKQASQQKWRKALGLRDGDELSGLLGQIRQQPDELSLMLGDLRGDGPQESQGDLNTQVDPKMIQDAEKLMTDLSQQVGIVPAAIAPLIQPKEQQIVNPSVTQNPPSPQVPATPQPAINQNPSVPQVVTPTVTQTDPVQNDPKQLDAFYAYKQAGGTDTLEQWKAKQPSPVLNSTVDPNAGKTSIETIQTETLPKSSVPINEIAPRYEAFAGITSGNTELDKKQSIKVQKVKSKVPVQTQTTTENDEQPVQYKFQETGKIDLKDGTQLTFDTDQNGVEAGKFRFVQPDGKKVIVDPESNVFQSEKSTQVFAKIKIPLSDKSSVSLGTAQQIQAEYAGSQVAAILRQRDTDSQTNLGDAVYGNRETTNLATSVYGKNTKQEVPTEDVIDYYRLFKFRDIKSGQDLAPDRYFYDSTKFDPISGLDEGTTNNVGKEEELTVTEEDIDAIREFSRIKQTKKAEFEEMIAKIKEAEPEQSDYEVRLRAMGAIGLGKQENIDKELQLFRQERRDFKDNQEGLIARYFNWLNSDGLEGVVASEKQVREEINRGYMNSIIAKYGSMQMRQQELDRIAKLPLSQKLAEGARTLGRVAPYMAGDLLKGGAIIQSLVTGQDADKTYLYEMGQAYRDTIDFILPRDVLASKSFIPAAIDGLGQVLVQGALAYYTGGATVPIMTGLAQGGANQYTEAKEAGATENQAKFNALIGSMAAMPEILLMNKWFKGLGKAEKLSFLNGLRVSIYQNLLKYTTATEANTITRSAWQAFINNAGKAGLEVAEVEGKQTALQIAQNIGLGIGGESTQEVGENKANKIVQKFTYNPKISWNDIVTLDDEDIQSAVGGAFGGAGGGTQQSIIESSRFQNYLGKKAQYAELDRIFADSALSTKVGGSFSLGGKKFEITEQLAPIVEEWREQSNQVKVWQKEIIKLRNKAQNATSFSKKRAILQEAKKAQTELQEWNNNRLDTFQRLSETIGLTPDSTTVPEETETQNNINVQLREDIQLTPDEQKVISVFKTSDENISTDELIDRTGLDIGDVLRVSSDLISKGVLDSSFNKEDKLAYRSINPSALKESQQGAPVAGTGTVDSKITMPEATVPAKKNFITIEPIEEGGKASKIEVPEGIDGQSLKLGYHQMKINDNFKKWFKGSKIVDENNNPKILYHAATDFKGEAFDPTKTSDGLIHVGTMEQAQTRIKGPAYLVKEYNETPIEERANYTWDVKNVETIPIVLSLKNPLRVNDLDTWDFSDIFSELIAKGVLTKNNAEYYDLLNINSNLGPSAQEAHKYKLIEFLQKQGYDGFVYQNEHESPKDNPQDSYAVFEPTQVKGIFNEGTWSKENPALLKKISETFKDKLAGAIEANLKSVGLKFKDGDYEKLNGQKSNYLDEAVQRVIDILEETNNHIEDLWSFQNPSHQVLLRQAVAKFIQDENALNSQFQVLEPLEQIAPITFKTPYSLSVLRSPEFESYREKNRSISKDTIRTIVNSSKNRAKNIEKEIINFVLDSPLFEGKSKVPFSEFENEVAFNLVPLNLISKNTQYDKYGAGYSAANFNPDDAETHIYNSTYDHGYFGHWYDEFVTNYTYGVKYIVKELSTKTNGTVYAVIDELEADDLTEENIGLKTIGFYNDKQLANVWAEYNSKNSGLNVGVFGHTRIWTQFDNLNPNVFVAEVQGEGLQKIHGYRLAPRKKRLVPDALAQGQIQISDDYNDAFTVPSAVELLMRHYQKAMEKSSDIVLTSEEIDAADIAEYIQELNTRRGTTELSDARKLIEAAFSYGYSAWKYDTVIKFREGKITKEELIKEANQVLNDETSLIKTYTDNLIAKKERDRKIKLDYAKDWIYTWQKEESALKEGIKLILDYLKTKGANWTETEKAIYGGHGFQVHHVDVAQINLFNQGKLQQPSILGFKDFDYTIDDTIREAITEQIEGFQPEELLPHTIEKISNKVYQNIKDIKFRKINEDVKENQKIHQDMIDNIKNSDVTKVLDLNQQIAKQWQKFQEALPLYAKQFVYYQNFFFERMVREEIKNAALNGAKTLSIPTPHTLVLIEQYLTREQMFKQNAINTPYQLHIAGPNTVFSNGTATFLDLGAIIEFEGTRYEVLSRFDEAELNDELGNTGNYIDKIRAVKIEDTITFTVRELERGMKEQGHKVDTTSIHTRYQGIKEFLEKQGMVIAYLDNEFAQYKQWELSSNSLDADTFICYYPVLSTTTKEFLQPSEYQKQSPQEHISDEELWSELQRDQQTIVRNYYKLNEWFKKERPDARVIVDKTGNTWLQTSITENDKVNPVLVFKVKDELDNIDKKEKLATEETKINSTFFREIWAVDGPSNSIKISDHAAELIRRVESQSINEEVAPFDAAFARPDSLNTIIPILEDVYNNAIEIGYTKGNLVGLENFITLLKERQSNETQTVLYTTDNALSHESIHQVRFLNAKLAESIDSYYGDFNEVFKSLIHISEIAYTTYFKRMYFNNKAFDKLTRQDKTILHEEVFTAIADGDYGKLGLTDEQAAEFFLKDLEAYTAKHGNQILNDIEVWVNEKIAKQALVQKIRDNQKTTNEPKETGDSVQEPSVESGAITEENSPDPEGNQATDNQKQGSSRRAFTETAIENLELNEEDLDPNTVFYQKEGQDKNAKDANEWLTNTGFQSAFIQVIDMEPSAQSTARRMAVMEHIDQNIDKAYKQGNLGLAKEWYEKQVLLANAIAPKFTEYGQAISQLARWAVIDANAIVAHVETKMARQGKAGKLDLKTQNQLREEAAEVGKLRDRVKELEQQLKNGPVDNIDDDIKESLGLKETALKVLGKIFPSLRKSNNRLLKLITQKGQRLGATGTAAQWINRNEGKVKDWGKYLSKKKEGLPVLKADVEAQWEAISNKEAIAKVSETQLGSYLERLANAEVELANAQVQQALWAYRNNPTQAAEKLEEWASKERKQGLNAWHTYLTKTNPTYAEDPFFRHYIWTGLTENLRDNNPDMPPGLDPAVLAAVYDEIQTEPHNKPFLRVYEELGMKIALENRMNGGKVIEVQDGTWIKIPQTKSDHPDFEQNTSTMRAVSASTWCTSRGMEKTYLPMGDFWVLIKNKQPSLALRFQGAEVVEIQGEANNGKIPLEFTPQVQELMDSGEVKFSKSSETKILNNIEKQKLINELNDITKRIAELKAKQAEEKVKVQKQLLETEVRNKKQGADLEKLYDKLEDLNQKRDYAIQALKEQENVLKISKQDFEDNKVNTGTYEDFIKNQQKYVNLAQKKVMDIQAKIDPITNKIAKLGKKDSELLDKLEKSNKGTNNALQKLLDKRLPIATRIAQNDGAVEKNNDRIESLKKSNKPIELNNYEQQMVYMQVEREYGGFAEFHKLSEKEQATIKENAIKNITSSRLIEVLENVNQRLNDHVKDDRITLANLDKEIEKRKGKIQDSGNTLDKLEKKTINQLEQNEGLVNFVNDKIQKLLEDKTGYEKELEQRKKELEEDPTAIWPKNQVAYLERQIKSIEEKIANQNGLLGGVKNSKQEELTKLEKQKTSKENQLKEQEIFEQIEEEFTNIEEDEDGWESVEDQVQYFEYKFSKHTNTIADMYRNDKLELVRAMNKLKTTFSDFVNTQFSGLETYLEEDVKFWQGRELSEDSVKESQDQLNALPSALQNLLNFFDSRMPKEARLLNQPKETVEDLEQQKQEKGDSLVLKELADDTDIIHEIFSMNDWFRKTVENGYFDDFSEEFIEQQYDETYNLIVNVLNKNFQKLSNSNELLEIAHQITIDELMGAFGNALDEQSDNIYEDEDLTDDDRQSELTELDEEYNKSTILLNDFSKKKKENLLKIEIAIVPENAVQKKVYEELEKFVQETKAKLIPKFEQMLTAVDTETVEDLEKELSDKTLSLIQNTIKTYLDEQSELEEDGMEVVVHGYKYKVAYLLRGMKNAYPDLSNEQIINIIKPIAEQRLKAPLEQYRDELEQEADNIGRHLYNFLDEHAEALIDTWPEKFTEGAEPTNEFVQEVEIGKYDVITQIINYYKLENTDFINPSDEKLAFDWKPKHSWEEKNQEEANKLFSEVAKKGGPLVLPEETIEDLEKQKVSKEIAIFEKDFADTISDRFSSAESFAEIGYDLSQEINKLTRDIKERNRLYTLVNEEMERQSRQFEEDEAGGPGKLAYFDTQEEFQEYIDEFKIPLEEKTIHDLTDEELITALEQRKQDKFAETLGTLTQGTFDQINGSLGWNGETGFKNAIAAFYAIATRVSAINGLTNEQITTVLLKSKEILINEITAFAQGEVGYHEEHVTRYEEELEFKKKEIPIEGFYEKEAIDNDIRRLNEMIYEFTEFRDNYARLIDRIDTTLNDLMPEAFLEEKTTREELFEAYQDNLKRSELHYMDDSFLDDVFSDFDKFVQQYKEQDGETEQGRLLLNINEDKPISDFTQNEQDALVSLGKHIYTTGKNSGMPFGLQDWMTSIINELASNGIDPTPIEGYYKSLFRKVNRELKQERLQKNIDRIKKKHSITDDTQARVLLANEQESRAHKQKISASFERDSKVGKDKRSAVDIAIDQELENTGSTLSRDQIKGVKDKNKFFSTQRDLGFSPKEINANYFEAVQIYIDATSGVQEAKQLHASMAHLAKQGISPNLTAEEANKIWQELEETRKAEIRKSAALGKTIRYLQDRPETGRQRLADWYLRVNRSGEALLTATLKTAAHNVLAQRATKLFNAIETATELIFAKLERASGLSIFKENKEGISPDVSLLKIAGEEIKSSTFPQIRQGIKELHRGTAGIMSAAQTMFNYKQRVTEGILAYNPDIYEKMIGDFTYGEAGTVKQTVDPNMPTAQKGIEYLIRGLEGYVHAMTALNRAQEKHFRFATFIATLSADLKAMNIDLNQVIDSHTEKIIPRSLLEKAMSRALEDTFAVDFPTDGVFGQFVTATHNAGRWVPFMMNPLLFRKFFYNSNKFMFEHSPLALGKLVTKGFDKRDAAKFTMGMGMLYFALQMLRMFGSDDDDPTLLRVRGKNIRMSAYNPISGFLVLANILRRIEKGKRPFKATGDIFKLIGIDTRYPNLALEWYKSIINLASSDESKWVKLGAQSEILGARGLVAFVRPLATIKDIIAQFDQNEAVVRDSGNRLFYGELSKTIPYLGQSLEGRVDVESGEVIRKTSPLLDQLGITFVPDRDTGPKFSPAEEYLEQVTRESREKNVKYKDEKQRKASAYAGQLYTLIDKGKNVEKQTIMYRKQGILSQQQQDRILEANRSKITLVRKGDDATIKMLVDTFYYANETEKLVLKKLIREKKNNQQDRGTLTPEEKRLADSILQP